ncbi:MAG: hypothetical protein ACUVX9_17650 [Anaerolineae bacterium]
MHSLLGVARYEFPMAIGRWSMWLAFVAIWIIYMLIRMPNFMLLTGLGGWQQAGLLALLANGPLPLLSGIVIADRLARDRRLGVSEILWATTLPRPSYILGKYAGALLAALTPALLLLLGTACYLAARPAGRVRGAGALGHSSHQPARLRLRRRILACLPGCAARARLSDPVHRLLVLGQRHQSEGHADAKRDAADGQR